MVGLALLASNSLSAGLYQPSLGEVVDTAANAYKVPSRLLYAVCKVESGFRHGAVHLNDGKGHSYGVCQVKLVTARRFGYRGSVYQLRYNERVNLEVAAAILAHYLPRKGLRGAISAYNAGHVSKSNKKYVAKVLKELHNG